jgi:hypothetical protein
VGYADIISKKLKFYYNLVLYYNIMSRFLISSGGPSKTLGQMIEFDNFIDAINSFKTTKNESALINFTPYLLNSSIVFLYTWIYNQKIAWIENPSNEFTISPPWDADEGIISLAELKETCKFKEAITSYNEVMLAGIYDFNKFKKNLSKQDWEVLQNDILNGRL